VSWIRLDDQAHAHPKINRVWMQGPPEALGFYFLALSYCGCYLTDGYVDHSFIVQKLPNSHERVLEALEAAGLIERREGHGAGFDIHDYLELNPSRRQIEADRRRKSQAGRAGARKTNAARSRNPAPDAGSEASAEPPAGGGADAPDPTPSLPLPIDSDVSLTSSVVARFNEAANGRNIDVDARLIGRALGDYKHLPDLQLEAYNCAEWLGQHAPANGSKPRVAHLTLRTWLKKRAEQLPKTNERSNRERRYTRPTNA
jgi:hypothetical protein